MPGDICTTLSPNNTLLLLLRSWFSALEDLRYFSIRCFIGLITISLSISNYLYAYEIIICSYDTWRFREKKKQVFGLVHSFTYKIWIANNIWNNAITYIHTQTHTLQFARIHVNKLLIKQATMILLSRYCINNWISYTIRIVRRADTYTSPIKIIVNPVASKNTSLYTRYTTIPSRVYTYIHI